MLTWILTYLLHSSVLILIVWALSKVLGDRHLPLTDSLWRLAVFGGLITASIQVGLAIDPLGGRLELGSSSGRVHDATPVPGTFSASDLDARLAVAEAGSEKSVVLAMVNRWLAFGWIFGAALSLLTVGWSHFRLERRLRDRREIENGDLWRLLTKQLDECGIAYPVRLTTSSRISVPLAMGLRHQEICLPEKAVRQLNTDQQEIILAHELAHLLRHDPRWLLALRLLESILFFQPLHRWARRQIQELAEYQCDDWAVVQTGRPLSLARCLANVAEWSLQKERSSPAPAFAFRGGALGLRVSRLLERSYPLPQAQRPTWLPPLAIISLLLATVAIPGFSLAQQEAPEAPAPPASPSSPPAPTEPEPPAEPTPPSEIRELEHKELHPVQERLEVQALALERAVAIELERLEKIPVERIEALEIELESVAEIHRLRVVEIEELRRRLHTRTEHEMDRRIDELHELQQERLLRQSEAIRQRQEIHKRRREAADQDPQTDPPS